MQIIEKTMINHYKKCILCPRNCKVNRTNGEIGACGETNRLRIGSAVIHKGEEPPLVGFGGSGTIFITGCNLGCSFCQNYQVSQGNAGSISLGRDVSPEEFASICAALQDKGAENINIVTGSHVVPSLIEGFNAARKIGVLIPILWNSSGYDGILSLELLKDHVDIYLPDLKTLDSEIAGKYFKAPDYPEAAKAAILKMIEMVHEKNIEDAQEKIIIRHLVLPGYLDSTRNVFKWFAENIKDKAMLSLMTQYTPIPNRLTKDGKKLPMPDRYISQEDYETVLYWAKEFNIEDGFCQELVTGSDWLPDFRKKNPFPSELSVPVWHFSSTSQI
ncbi:MAG: radical SAM protein [Treponema sp.]|nr:radical SAM protein [Treponema sp.]